MKYLNFASKYDRFPKTKIKGYDNFAYEGWDRILTVSYTHLTLPTTERV